MHIPHRYFMFDKPWNRVTIYQPYIETPWLSITITEGKFRQVRKTVAAIRHRCMRLIRTSIEDMELENLLPGEIKEIDEPTFFLQ